MAKKNTKGLKVERYYTRDGVNPFDQFGVELGKEMAKALDSDAANFDPSTNALMARAFG